MQLSSMGVSKRAWKPTPFLWCVCDDEAGAVLVCLGTVVKKETGVYWLCWTGWLCGPDGMLSSETCLRIRRGR